MKKVMLVFGTRPEAIKMCPLILELKKQQSIQTVVVVSGQHREMLDQVLDVFGVKPDYNLSIMQPRQDLFDITGRVMDGMKRVLKQVKPDLVLVHGDTSTSFAASLSCFYLNIPVGHVEAGLRTNDINQPYPEEFNRRVISMISDIDFAPTEQAKINLVNEGKDESKIFITGNTAIDALKITVRDNYKNKELDWLDGDKLILLTAHRRENLGDPMRNMFRAIKRCLDEHTDIKVIYPIHLNPVIREIADEIFSDSSRIHIIEPLDVFDFHNMMNHSHIILTDSGGIQEEAPSLGVPVLVMRDQTERPEGVQAGTLKVVGTDETNIYNSFKLLLENDIEYKKMSCTQNPYGDGTASLKITNIIKEYLEA